ncbi:MAG: HutD family protein, partial [Mesorhizobium sp.]
DLNVMTRRNRMAHTVERLPLSGEMRIEQNVGTTLILPVGGGMKVFADSVSSLGPLDTLVLDRNSPKPRLQPEGQGLLYVIRLHAVAAND